MTAQRFVGGLQTSLPCGTGRRDNLVSEHRIGSLKSVVCRSLEVGTEEEEAVATKVAEFAEKWDSDHPTRCCEVGRTPIGKSFGAKLVKTTRKVVSKSEVDANDWECMVALAASAIACNMHA